MNSIITHGNKKIAVVKHPDVNDDDNYYEANEVYISLNNDPPVIVEVYIWGNDDYDKFGEQLLTRISYQSFHKNNRIDKFYHCNFDIKTKNWDWENHSVAYVKKYILPLFDTENPGELIKTYEMEQML